ncbi:hypothetical protein ACS0TY_003959 [Phlomoides rotata]
MLGVPEIGLDNTTYHIDALPEVDHTARGLKNKTFPFYQDWINIFGNDRANGSESQHYSDAVNKVKNKLLIIVQLRLDLIKQVKLLTLMTSLHLNLHPLTSVRVALQLKTRVKDKKESRLMG